MKPKIRVAVVYEPENTSYYLIDTGEWRWIKDTIRIPVIPGSLLQQDVASCS